MNRSLDRKEALESGFSGRLVSDGYDASELIGDDDFFAIASDSKG